MPKPYQAAIRDTGKPRGKWHLIALMPRVTICGARVRRDADRADRATLDPNDICTPCLRDTP